MSDAAQTDEDYTPVRPAIAPSEPRYQTGLPSPVANANEGPRFKGAMGGAAVGNEYPDHEPRLSVPYNRYKQLESSDPTLYEAINHVAEEQRIPPTDLAAIVYASSNNDPSARDGARVGYTGLTVNDSRQLDPEGQLDISKPVDNLFLGAEKYKRIADRYGMGTPATFAAYHAGPDRVDGVLQHHPDQHRSIAPAGMFDFVNRVAGRDRGEGSGSSTPPTPEDAGAGMLGAEPAPGGDVGEMARQAATQPPERFTPTSQPVPPMTPSAPPPGPELRVSPPQYAPGTEPSDATRDIIRERATNPAPPYFTPGRPAIGQEPNYNLDPNAPIPAPSPPPAVAGQGNFGPQYPPTAGPTAEPPGPDYTPPPRDVPSAPTVLPPDVAAALPTSWPPRSPTDMQGGGDRTVIPPGQPGRVGRAPYPGMVGGDYGGGGEPTPPVPTTGSAAPARPRAALAPSTDNMAADLNRQELARVQANRPDVIPTGPTQALAGAPPPVPSDTTAAAPAGAPATPTTPTTTTASTNPKDYTAIGDSLALHLTNFAGVGGKQQRRDALVDHPDSTAVGGINPKTVLALINKTPVENIKDQNVILSSGASNDPTQLDQIPAQIKALKDRGAKSVTLLGVGTRSDLAGVNDKLAQLAADPNNPIPVKFAGALPNVAPDRIHSTDYNSVFRAAVAAGAPTAAGVVAGATAAATTTPPGGAPPAGTGMTTPPPAAARAATGPVAGSDAPKAAALAPPGSPAATPSQGPIDRLNTNTGAMSTVGAIRASAAGGPNGLLTYMTRSLPRGMSMGDGWNRLQDGMIREALLRGDTQAAMHAKEFVFEIQHQGAMDNLMRAVGSWGDDPNRAADPNGVAQFLAKSHAFVTDGAVIGFQPVNGQVWGQRYDEQTHDKIGQPFQVTRGALMGQAMANSDRKNFFTNQQHAQTANETARHNRNTETHADQQLVETAKDREARMKEKKFEFDTSQENRLATAAQADQRHREMQQIALDAQAARDHEKNLAKIQADALVQQNKENARAETSRQQQAAVNTEVTELYGQAGTLPKDVQIKADAAGNDFTAEQLRQARGLHGVIRNDNFASVAPATAADYAQGLVAGTYTLRPSTLADGTPGPMGIWDTRTNKQIPDVKVNPHRASQYLPPGKVTPGTAVPVPGAPPRPAAQPAP